MRPNRETLRDVLELLTVIILAVTLFFTVFYRQALRVGIESDTPRIFWLCNKGEERWNLIAQLTFRMINKGEIPAYFHALQDNPKVSPVRASYGDQRLAPIG